MKKYLLILFLTLSFNGFSQEISIQPVPESESASFPGGDEAFSKEFLKMVHSYIDLQLYSVNGKFVFIFDVNENGKATNLKVLPKVKNSEMFIEDMEFAMKKIKKKWKPAVKNGKAVVSQKIIRINFTTDYYDHGD